MFRAFFFDMDGVIYDSMPNHARAWEEVMTANGLDFTAKDCYLQEGRTGQSVIAEAMRSAGTYDAMPEAEREAYIWNVYRQKSNRFHELGGGKPMRGVADVLRYIGTPMADRPAAAIWIVTGSGQQTLFDGLKRDFPGVFARERMITAYDVERGKPDPEPYLKAWEKSGFSKNECCVVENAPMGCRAGHAAGLFTIGVNTGPLDDDALYSAGADIVFPDMFHLLEWLQTND